MSKEILLVHKGGEGDLSFDPGAGYTVTRVATVAGADEMAARTFYHMIFLDAASLGIHAFSQFQSIREASPRSVIVLMSEFEPGTRNPIFPSSGDMDAALKNEQCLVVQKPCDAATVVAQVARVHAAFLKSKENTVLFIEDTESLLETFIPILEEEGYVVTGVTNGTDALKELHSHSFATVVSDYRLPDMTGADVINRVKQIDPWVSVIFMTGFSDMDAVIKSLQGKVIDFLTKPIDIARMYEALAKAKAARNAVLDKEQ